MNTSEIPKPATTAAIFPTPTKEPGPQVQRPVHSQQTTVYVAKDLGTAPQTPVPQYGPEKIVIPISSLYPGGARPVSTPSASIHEEANHQEIRGEFVKQFKVPSFSFYVVLHA